MKTFTRSFWLRRRTPARPRLLPLHHRRHRPPPTARTTRRKRTRKRKRRRTIKRLTMLQINQLINQSINHGLIATVWTLCCSQLVGGHHCSSLHDQEGAGGREDLKCENLKSLLFNLKKKKKSPNPTTCWASRPLGPAAVECACEERVRRN